MDDINLVWKPTIFGSEKNAKYICKSQCKVLVSYEIKRFCIIDYECLHELET